MKVVGSNPAPWYWSQVETEERIEEAVDDRVGEEDSVDGAGGTLHVTTTE